jgi:rubrerythrin
MPELSGSVTLDNLKTAFGLESQSIWRYRYYATIADFEGYGAVAQFFNDVAESDAINAHGHLDFIKTVGDPITGTPIGETGGNLNAAMTSDLQHARDLYPAMARQARDEGFADIADWFEVLAKSKHRHAALFQKIADSIS